MVNRQAQKLGRRIGELERNSSVVNLNQGGRDINPSFVLRNTENIIANSLIQNVTKLLICTDSFVLDHPTKGELDSPTLKLDKAYCDFEDVVEETSYDFLAVDNNETPLFAGQGAVIDFNA